MVYSPSALAVGGFRVAQFVLIALDPNHCPFMAVIALSASCGKEVESIKTFIVFTASHHDSYFFWLKLLFTFNPILMRQPNINKKHHGKASEVFFNCFLILESMTLL